MTFWATPRQPKHGTCLDHMVPQKSVTRAGERLAEDVVLAVFPQATFRPPEMPTEARVVVRGIWLRLRAVWWFTARVSTDLLSPGPAGWMVWPVRTR